MASFPMDLFLYMSIYGGVTDIRTIEINLEVLRMINICFNKNISILYGIGS